VARKTERQRNEGKTTVARAEGNKATEMVQPSPHVLHLTVM
jgi:hypothetical protein